MNNRVQDAKGKPQRGDVRSNEIIFRTPAATIDNPPPQPDVFDTTAKIERMGGRVAKFWTGKDTEPRYEALFGSENYGPMDEAELYWFARGLSR
jgi:hypothetical protein